MSEKIIGELPISEISSIIGLKEYCSGKIDMKLTDESLKVLIDKGVIGKNAASQMYNSNNNEASLGKDQNSISTIRTSSKRKRNAKKVIAEKVPLRTSEVKTIRAREDSLEEIDTVTSQESSPSDQEPTEFDGCKTNTKDEKSSVRVSAVDGNVVTKRPHSIKKGSQKRVKASVNIETVSIGGSALEPRPTDVLNTTETSERLENTTQDPFQKSSTEKLQQTGNSAKTSTATSPKEKESRKTDIAKKQDENPASNPSGKRVHLSDSDVKKNNPPTRLGGLKRRPNSGSSKKVKFKESDDDNDINNNQEETEHLLIHANQDICSVLRDNGLNPEVILSHLEYKNFMTLWREAGTGARLVLHRESSSDRAKVTSLLILKPVLV